MINKFIRKNNFSTTNIFTILFFTVFVIKLLNNLQTQKYFYGDDSWLLLGSRFDSIFDSLRCCAASHPIFTIFAQGIFNVLNFSTETTIVFFLIYSCLLSLLTFFLPTKFFHRFFVFVVKEYNIALKLTNKTTSHIFLETMSRQIPTQFFRAFPSGRAIRFIFFAFQDKKGCRCYP